MRKSTVACFILVLVTVQSSGAGSMSNYHDRPFSSMTDVGEFTNTFDLPAPKMQPTNCPANMPLYFVANQGQVDQEALFYARGPDFTLWLTKDSLVFDSSRRTASAERPSHDSTLEIGHRESRRERVVSAMQFHRLNSSSEIISLEPCSHRVNYFFGQDPSQWYTDIPTSQAVLYKDIYKNTDLRVYAVATGVEYDWFVKPGGNIHEIQFEYKGAKATRLREGGDLIVVTELGEIVHCAPLCYQIIDGKKICVEGRFRRLEDNLYGFEIDDYDEHATLVIDPVVMTYSTYLGGSSSDYGNDIVVDAQGSVYVVGETFSGNFPTKNALDRKKNEWDVFVAKFSPTGMTLVYSTFLGGRQDDFGNGIALDSTGSVYISGTTKSTDFPVKDSYDDKLNGDYDAFVTKLSAGGNSLVFSTYIGGTYYDCAWGIAIDGSRASYVAGITQSPDFPLQKAVDKTPGVYSEGFITKISPSGTTLVYSTYLGGSDSDYISSIAVDKKGAASVTGTTGSDDFPIKNAYDKTFGGFADAFVTKLSPAGSAFVFSTYLGGVIAENGKGIACDDKGSIYVTGLTASENFPLKNAFDNLCEEEDAFVTKFSGSGKLLFSTYLGGGDDDYGSSITVDRNGAIYLTGTTISTDFPRFNGLPKTPVLDYDAFVTVFTPAGNSLSYSTCLGGYFNIHDGPGKDEGVGITVDQNGSFYVTGYTESTDFPTKDAFDAKYNGDNYDAFVTKFEITEIP